jgi:GTP-binding protein HflX
LSDVFAKDLLFATLDPTMRRLKIPGTGQDVILSDTVGFISDLPTHLIAAFRATLEQVKFADVILHVRDVSRPDHEVQRDDVIAILNDLGIDYDHDERIVEVLNKIDLLPAEGRDDILRQARHKAQAIAVSALEGTGTADLLALAGRKLAAERLPAEYDIPHATAGEALAWLHQHATVQERADHDDGVRVRVAIDPARAGQFATHFGFRPLNGGFPDGDNNDDD